MSFALSGHLSCKNTQARTARALYNTKMTRGNEWVCRSHQFHLSINTPFCLCCILNYLYRNTHTMHKQSTNRMARSLHLHGFAWDARIGIIYSWAITTCRFRTENSSLCSLSPSAGVAPSLLTTHLTLTSNTRSDLKLLTETAQLLILFRHEHQFINNNIHLKHFTWFTGTAEH